MHYHFKAVRELASYCLSIVRAISNSLQTYVVQMPPFISPLSVCQPVVHWFLAVAPISA